MATADIRLFLASWLRSPMQVGALVPSSGALAHCMAAQVDPSKPGLVVELGPGTGTVTRALLARPWTEQESCPGIWLRRP